MEIPKIKVLLVWLVVFMCSYAGASLVMWINHSVVPLNNSTISAAKAISVSDMQALLNEIEPANPIKVDGILGPATQEKWDRVYCNQCAVESFIGDN